MGAYMAKPSTQKSSCSGSTEWMTYGVSSMQGWRMQQEDAHTCEPDFDSSRLASLFAVYDGHGGSEVARYCAVHLPTFLKELPTYSTGDPTEVLKQLFIEFDASLVTPKVREILNSYAEKDEKLSNESCGSDEESESELNALKEEADKPLEAVLKRYGGEDSLPPNIKDLLVHRRQAHLDNCGTSVSAVGTADRSDDAAALQVNKVVENIETVVSSTCERNARGPQSASTSVANCASNGEDTDSSEVEELDSTEEVDEDTSTSKDTDDEDEDEDEDSAFQSLRLGVPSALKHQDDTEPGLDSGTTACVALILPLNGCVKLYVANAGDSRAVLCRNGTALDLSVDHKPEDEDEKARITAAGGTVTRDGRVNGGLNLSRALGDHSYKQVKDLPLTSQMITPSPDVTQFDLQPDSDEFLVIACDGVWNSMTSQEVVDFVHARLQKTPTDNTENGTEMLSKICEEIFDHCLAPNTDGDGTGCDNMTCIIVRFHNLEGLAKRSLEVSCESSSIARKRVAASDQIGPSQTSDQTVITPKRSRIDASSGYAASETGVTNGNCI